MKQITNPNEDFVIQRLKGIPNISGYQAVTEDHDPNGNLNKQEATLPQFIFLLLLSTNLVYMEMTL